MVYKEQFILKTSNKTIQTKPNKSKPVLRQRTITKLVGISLLWSGIIFIASNRMARFTALSIVALSIIATSSVVYSLTFNLNKDNVL